MSPGATQICRKLVREVTLPTRMQTPAGRRIASTVAILVVLVTIWVGGVLLAVAIGLAACIRGDRAWQDGWCLGSGASHFSRSCVGCRHFCQLPLHTGTQGAENMEEPVSV